MKGLYKKIGMLAIPAVIALLIVSVIAEQPKPSPVPVIPYAQYGSLLIGKRPAPDGIKVEAFISGLSCGQASQTKNGLYTIVVRANDVTRPGCGNEGDEVIILAEGQEIDRSVWHSGQIVREDLTINPPKKIAIEGGQSGTPTKVGG